jgi:hypothetical protein
MGRAVIDTSLTAVRSSILPNNIESSRPMGKAVQTVQSQVDCSLGPFHLRDWQSDVWYVNI